MSREADLLSEIAQLRLENERLRQLLAPPAPTVALPAPAITGATLKVHYIYATPLVLLDNLGTTVIETFDPLRVDTEFKRISESIATPPPAASFITQTASTISVASPSNLLQLKHLIDDDRTSLPVVHISMHTVDIGSVRCALEDDNGRGFLMTPEEFASSLGLNDVKLVFINACKSLEIGKTILATCPSVAHVVCLGTSEPVLESAALLFANEFYPSLMRMSIHAAFERAKLAVKLNPRVASQATLFRLLPEGDEFSHSESIWSTGSALPSIRSTHTPTRSLQVVAQSPLRLGKSTPFWIGHVGTGSSAPEDFVGRQVDIVRLCGVMFSGTGRRVCAVTGAAGIGKDLFLTEASKYLASPGGRHFSGGICVVQLPPHPASSDGLEDIFLRILIEGVTDTIASLKNWYRIASSGHPTPAEEEDEEEEDVVEEVVGDDALSGTKSKTARRPRFDSTMSDIDEGRAAVSPTLPPVDDLSEQLSPDSTLKSYKVFWADTFSSQEDLLAFLDSYRLSLPLDSSLRLFNELRLNGTQLQDWGAGRLIRVVHVVRLLIKGENDKYLLEKNQGLLRMLSKKFDPVTENVLEVASTAVRKELGVQIDGRPVVVTRLVLRDRKPQIEISRTSPSYPGLATKYVLYTADVSLTGLSVEVSKFETVELESKKLHSWEWTLPDSGVLQALLPTTDAIHAKRTTSLEMQFNGTSHTLTLFDHGKPLQKEYARLMREWGGICDSISRNGGSSGLVLLNADQYLKNPVVRQVLGKSLVRHAGLKILFTQQSLSSKSLLNLDTSSVSYKIIHFPLPPLQPIDSAVLFTRRIHRPLYPRDWWVEDGSADVAPPPFVTMASREGLSVEEVDENEPLRMSTKSSKGVANLVRLARHPLLLAAAGVPERILALAQQVTMELSSINELVGIHTTTDFA